MAIGNLREIIPAFFTGPNGEPLTPDQIAQRQQVAQSLMQQASDTSPNAGGWASILAKGLQGGVSAYQRGRADDAAALNAKNDQANIEAGLGSIFGGGAFPSAVSQGAFPSAVAQVASPTSGVATGTGGVATGTGVSLPGNLGSIINDAASRYNVDPAAMSVIAQIESGGNVNAKNPNSSAGGPFQFIDSTAKQYGLKDRFDPVQASDAAARLTRDNAAVLTKALGRAPTAGELYLAHQQGSGGASKLLSNPNARAVDIVGRDAVRLNGGDENMTALSFANKWINKADRLMGTPQQAIQSISPIEQGDENPAAGIAPIAQAGNAYVDPIVAANPYQEAGQVAPMAMTAEAQAPQQPQIDPRLAALNDQMLGGAFSPTGRNEVAQALTGYFPDAPSANRAPITAQNNAMSQAPMQQQTGGVNPQIIASLLGPNSSPQARQVGALLIGQHQRQQAAMQAQQQAQQELAQRQQVAQSMGIDPNAALDTETWKAAVDKANRNRSTVTVGNVVYDSNTGQPVIHGTPENPTSVQEYEYGVRNPEYFERQESLKRAGANSVTTNVGGEGGADSSLRKKLSEKEGENWAAYKDQGAVSAGTAQDMALLDSLITMAPQGPVQGRLAQMFPGFNSAAAAFESVVKRVAPTLRAPGSGSTSDIEYDGMLKSLPGLQNNPEANAAISAMMKAKAAINMERSAIVDAYQNEEITAAEARREIAKINSRSIMTPEIEKTFSALGIDVRDVGDAGSAPDGVDPAVWNVMTPEERKLWQQ